MVLSFKTILNGVMCVTCRFAPFIKVICSSSRPR